MGQRSSKCAVSKNRDGKCMKSKAIGIDLGTTYSCVGVWQHDRIEIIANDQGNRTTPSMAAFTSKFQVVGEAARFQIANNPKNTVFNAKRLIGRRFSDPCVQADIRLWPFTVVSGKNDDKPMIQVSYKGKTRLFSPEDISAMVLSKMKKTAENFLNCHVKDAVITVPAYFSNSQKRATKDAGKIAGLNVMKMINEPTAAAICYGFHASAGVKKNVFVFDLGGGTFDASIVRVEKGKIEVKAVGGNMHLGGEDFDNRLLDYCINEFKRKYKSKMDLCANSKSLRRLRAECERAKRSLSCVAETVIDIDGLCDGQDFHIKISRAKFEEINADLFKKCMQIVNQCLEDAKMSNAHIDEIVLVGGSSRIPKIQELLGKVFVGKKICKSVNPEEAVAYGAAVQAAVLNKEKVELEVVEVAPLSLGVDIIKGVMKVAVPRNTRIPTLMEISLTTLYDNQRSVNIAVYEGERLLVAHNNLLGSFLVDGIPPMRAGLANLKVCFEVGADGIVRVSAMNKETGKNNEISISNERRSLRKKEIDRMVAEARKFRSEDEAAKEKVEARTKLECYVYNMKSRAMEAKNNEVGIIKSINETEEWLKKNECVGVEKLQAKLKQLELECTSLK